jgi:hypothetical protein
MTYQEIITKIEKLTGTSSSTNSTYPLADKISDICLALDNYNLLGINSSGLWQSSDDTNHEDYPIIYDDIAQGKQDYIFTVDEQGNQVLDIYKVRIKDENGNWRTLKQRDFQSQQEEVDFETTGQVTEYDLTANGIFLTSIPNYDMVDGLEVWISRTNVYPTVTTLANTPGIPNIFHEYLALRPSYFNCLQNELPQANSYGYILYGADRKSGMEKQIENFHASRNRAVKPNIKPKVENTM